LFVFQSVSPGDTRAKHCLVSSQALRLSVVQMVRDRYGRVVVEGPPEMAV